MVFVNIIILLKKKKAFCFINFLYFFKFIIIFFLPYNTALVFSFTSFISTLKSNVNFLLPSFNLVCFQHF